MFLFKQILSLSCSFYVHLACVRVAKNRQTAAYSLWSSSKQIATKRSAVNFKINLYNAEALFNSVSPLMYEIALMKRRF